MDPNFEEIQRQLALSMAQLKENIEPIFETAEGIRADMVKRTWSPAMAERIAGEWLVMMIRKLGEM